ncbi:MAG: tRNA (adenosine(37)-N6)-threonylcarbamoyltransferase complex ATPase subunit type 1 TsaE [Spirochaetaceae bacterium]|nr:tRNA (adenosine(37)-N6)-threonylcarbamoyltransferase complex ATPase subunit type 1 TsaE [Spirochaetaceae bacterium]
MYLTNSPEETEAVGERLAAALQPGSVVALYGGLGAGKTCFTRGLARGLAVTDAVTSPTYTIVNTYRGTLSGIGPTDIHHIDAYRLRDADDFVNIGGEELLAGDGVCIVEWPERIARCLPEDAIPVAIGLKAGDKREIRIAGDTAGYDDCG